MKAYVYCLVAFLLGAAVAWGQVDGVSRVRTEVNDGMEVLTRGPVHEAFAETVTFDPEPGIVTPKMPPAAIEEVPPEPPATIQVGPRAPVPSADHIWLPGCWLWQQNRYAWRPGYWAAWQSDFAQRRDHEEGAK